LAPVLQAPFDEHAVIALAGGEDGREKRENRDFALTRTLARVPQTLGDVEGGRRIRPS